MTMLAFLAALATAAPPDDASLHALCTELTAGWQGAPGAGIGLGAADPSVDPGQDLPEAAAWTCRYTRKAVNGAPTWAGVALVRIQDAGGEVDATHLALAVSGVGWVHLGLLYDVLRDSQVGGKVVRFEVSDLVYGDEPEILVVSEARDLQSFERTARLCVDRHQRRGRVQPATCVAIPLAAGEGKRARKDAEHLELRIERDGRIALEQPRDRELDLLAPLAGVHDLGSLDALGKELGPCDDGPCLRFYSFDEPADPAPAPPAPP